MANDFSDFSPAAVSTAAEAFSLPDACSVFSSTAATSAGACATDSSLGGSTASSLGSGVSSGSSWADSTPGS